jgi:hypothetical protein
MNDSRFQHLAGAFNSIIKMMLAMIRARGLRGLIDLPKMILLALYLRRIGKEFAALIASLDAGALAPPTAAPWPTQQGTPAQPAEPGSAHCDRQPPAVRPAAPAKAHRARPTAAATPPRRTRTPQVPRHQAYARPRRTPDPRAILTLLDTARTS